MSVFCRGYTQQPTNRFYGIIGCQYSVEDTPSNQPIDSMISPDVSIL
jgi:hypothetical protein